MTLRLGKKERIMFILLCGCGLTRYDRLCWQHKQTAIQLSPECNINIALHPLQTSRSTNTKFFICVITKDWQKIVHLTRRPQGSGQGEVGSAVFWMTSGACLTKKNERKWLKLIVCSNGRLCHNTGTLCSRRYGWRVWVTACDTEQICCWDGKKLILPDGTQSTYTQMFMCAVGEWIPDRILSQAFRSMKGLFIRQTCKKAFNLSSIATT